MDNDGRIYNSKLEEFPDDDLDIEVVDLDTLDDTNDTQKSRIAPWSSPVLHWQRALNRKQLRIASTIGSLALVLLIVFLNLHSTLALLASVQRNTVSLFIKPPLKLLEKLPTPVNIQPSLVISPRQAGFSCVTNNAWSPDSQYIALLGYSNGCFGSQSNTAGLVTIHNAHTGKRIAQIQPGSLILQMLHVQFPTTQGAPEIYYTGVLWSPDGLRLALLFDVIVGSPSSLASFSSRGLLLFDESNKCIQVLLQRQSPQSPVFAGVEWDTIRGKVVPGSPAMNTPQGSFNSGFPATSSYVWSENGALTPHMLASSRSTAIGNPDGDASFSIRQPGMIGLVSQSGQDSTASTSGAYTWDARLIAWSPDGRYLVSGNTTARLEPQGQPHLDHKTLINLQLDKTSLFPVHDAAFEFVLKTFSEEYEAGSFSAMAVCWSPNGQLLGSTSYQESGSVSVYASNSGYKIATLFPPRPSSLDPSQEHNGSFFDFNPPKWSQDGSHIFMQDSISNDIAIWSVAQLMR